MPINRTDIKMKESQRLDDTDYGGGQLTLNDVVSGEMNNLFPDISRMDRTYGRVSMRKAYMHVETSDRSTYYGAHAVLTKNAKDPHVSVCFFSDGNFFSQRKEAQNRMESYLIRGPQLMAALYGNYTKNMRKIQLHAPTTLRVPAIGDVLVLVANSGTVNEFQQFVRTTKVDERIEDYAVGDNTTIRKKIIDIELSTVLEYDFRGTEIFQGVGGYSSKLETCIYTSTVADAASYYGVADLESDAKKGDSSIKVTDMQVPLLPCTTSETSITDVGVNGSTVESTCEFTDKESSTVTITKNISYKLSSNSVFHIGTAVQRGSLSLRVAGQMLSDNSKGDIVNSGNVHVGSIDYATGDISFGNSAPTGTGTGSISYIPAIKFTQPSISAAIKIGINNRGFIYTYICNPVPAAGSLTIHFLSNNKWYVLQDKGNGELKGVEESIGAGTVNLTSGHVSLALGAMPDVGSSILLLWAKKDRVTDLSGDDYDLQFEIDLKNQGVNRNSFVCSWNNGTYAVMDDGGTYLYVATKKNDVWIIADTAEKVGTINYSSGKVVFRPGTIQELPSCMEQFSIQYSCGDSIEQVFSAPMLQAGGYLKLQVTNKPIQRGSVEIEWNTLLQKYSPSGTEVSAKQTVQIVSIDPTHTYVDEVDPSDTSKGYFKGEKEDFSLLKTDKLRDLNAQLESGKTLEEIGPYADSEYEGRSTINYTTGVITFKPNRVGFFPVPNYEWRDTGREFTEPGTDTIQTLYGPMEIDTTITKKEQEYSFSKIEYKFTACEFPSSGSVTVKYRSDGDGDHQKTESRDVQYRFAIKPTYKCELVRGSVQLLAGGAHLVDNGNGKLYYDIDSATGIGPECGTIDYATKVVTITTDEVLTSSGSVVPMDIRKIRVISAAGTNNINSVSFFVFRTPGAPLSPQSVYVKANVVTLDTKGIQQEEEVVGESDEHGFIHAQGDGGIEGSIDYTTGLCQVYFGKWVETSTFGNDKPEWYAGAVKSKDGSQVWQPYSALASSITVSCVVTSYVALNSETLGINPIRLPIDGKVPIFRKGDVILIHRTGEHTIGSFAEEATTIEVGETLLGDLAIYDKNGKYFPEVTGGAYCPTGKENKRNYTVDLAKGEIKTSGSFDFNIYDKPQTGGTYEQYESPFTALYRVEDMLLCVDTQINGTLGLNQPLRHDYLIINKPQVSSVLPCGDLQAGAYGEFIQSNWTGVWSDDLIGNKPDAGYDFTRSPIQIDNKGGIKERWVIRFTSDKTIDVIGEGLGVIIAGLTIDTNNEFGTPNGLEDPTIIEANPDISGGFNVGNGVKDLVQMGGGWYKKNGKYVLQAISRYTSRPYWSMEYDGFSTGWKAGNCIRFNTVAASVPFWFIRTTLQFPAEENTDKYQFLMRGDSI